MDNNQGFPSKNDRQHGEYNRNYGDSQYGRVDNSSLYARAGSESARGGEKVGNGKYHYLLTFNKKHLFLLSLFVSLMFAFFFISGFALADYLKKDSNNGIVLQDTQNIRNEAFPTRLQFIDGEEVQDIDPAFNGVDGVNKKSNIVFESEIDSREVLNTANGFLQKGVSDNLQKGVDPTLNESEIPVLKTSKSSSASGNEYEREPESGKEYYFLQVMVTKDFAKATRIAKRLRAEKYLAVIHKREVSAIENLAQTTDVEQIENKFEYVLRIGLYKDKKIALRHLSLLQDYAGFKDAFIRAYRI